MGRQELTAEELHRLYWKEGLSCAQIARRFGIGGEAVRQRMVELGIPRHAAGWNTPRIDLDPEEIRRLYWEEGLSLEEVGRRFGLGAESIALRMRAHGIPRRSNSEAVRRAHARQEFPNLTGYRGVVWRRGRARPYEANIRVGSRVKCLGYFATPAQAHEAYRRAALALGRLPHP